MKTETKPTHTPGPWMLDQADYDSSFSDMVQIGEHKYHVRRVNDKDASCEDMRLIAAAPELLEALKGARDWLNSKAIIDRSDYKLSGFAHWILKLDATIAKAEGR